MWPLVSERENIIDPFDLVATTEPWKVNPEGYEDLSEVPSISTLFDQVARNEIVGIYLGSAETYHLILEVQGENGVCTLMSGANNPEYQYFYALTNSNERSQVDSINHVSGGCPCCGVGMIWHASRVHMPRTEAIEIFESAINHDYSKANWLKYDHNDRCYKGKG